MKSITACFRFPVPFSLPSRRLFPDRESGFSLIELVAVLFIGSMMVTAAWDFFEHRVVAKQVVDTESAIIGLSEALYTYRMNEREWPAQMSDLAVIAPILSQGGRNGVGQRFTLAPPTPLNDPALPITIRTDLLEVALARKVAREFPNSGRVVGTTVEIEVPIPGHEPAREAMVPRDGEREMEGDLDMDDNDVVGAGTVETTILRSGDQVMDENTLAFLNSLMNLSCEDNEKVVISGGSASCGDSLGVKECPSASIGCTGGAYEWECRRRASDLSCQCECVWQK